MGGDVPLMPIYFAQPVTADFLWKGHRHSNAPYAPEFFWPMSIAMMRKGPVGPHDADNKTSSNGFTIRSGTLGTGTGTSAWASFDPVSFY